jgi:hypothetical protein
MRGLLLSAFVLAAFAAEAPVRVVGEFSNVRYTHEHEYGYSVQLWRRGDELFGFLLSAAGLQGDTPMGVLEDVRFDPNTGKLQFRSKLTVGIIQRNGGNEPSRDLFEFNGVLRGSIITGVLRHKDNGIAAATELVKLRKVRQDSLFQPLDFAAWQKDAAKLLSRRGPKW